MVCSATTISDGCQVTGDYYHNVGTETFDQCKHNYDVLLVFFFCVLPHNYTQDKKLLVKVNRFLIDRHVTFLSRHTITIWKVELFTQKNTICSYIKIEKIAFWTLVSTPTCPSKITAMDTFCRGFIRSSIQDINGGSDFKKWAS